MKTSPEQNEKGKNDIRKKRRRNSKHKLVESKIEEEECVVSVIDPQPKGKDTWRHAFVTNPLDHCESPSVAFRHLQVVLDEICKLTCKKDLILWDPYYCDGSVKRHMASLGYTNMIHNNQDFYSLIEQHSTPKHDVFMTNPPYSENHIDRLLQYLNSTIKEKKRNNTTFCLLMPNWVARKKNYRELIQADMFYLSPIKPYVYEMPQWNERPDHVGENGLTKPYLSSWYIHAGTHTDQLQQNLEQHLRELRNSSIEWVTAKTIKGLKWKIQKHQKRRL